MNEDHETALEAMTKDQLVRHAMDAFHATLNPRDPKADLVKQVLALQGDAPHAQNVQDETSEDTPVETVSYPEYLRNKKTGVVFITTDTLRKKAGMVPCDENGQAL